MKGIIYFFLNRMFGKKQHYRFFLILKNIGMQGMNFRNTDLHNNGELFLIKELSRHFEQSKEQTVLFDVGANVGNYSRQLLANFPAASVIHAFEPFSVPFSQLEAMQRSHPNLHAHRLGLSDKNEDLLMYSSDEYSEIGGVYNRDVIFKDMQEMNPFVTIDSFCKRQNIPRIHFLKIDVEGHELSVLKGATTLLEQGSIDVIQFEFGAGNHFSRTYFLDFFNLLDPHYRLYRLLSDGLLEIKGYNSELDMQVLTYFVAVHKNSTVRFSPGIYAS